MYRLRGDGRGQERKRKKTKAEVDELRKRGGYGSRNKCQRRKCMAGLREGELSEGPYIAEGTENT